MRARAEEDTARVGPVDVVIVAVKAYDNASALPLIAPMIGPQTTILPLQNGVDSAGELAARFGEAPVVGGVTYIATALAAPGVIEQTGTHRRIVFGEVFGALPRMTDRVGAIRDALAGADIQAEAVEDGRVPIWEKFIFLVSLAGFTGASRLPIGPIVGRPVDPRAVPRQLPRDRAPRARRGRAGRHRHRGAHRRVRRRHPGDDAVVAADRSVAGKADRGRAAAGIGRAPRGRAPGVPVPITSTLYAVLKPWADGARRSA